LRPTLALHLEQATPYRIASGRSLAWGTVSIEDGSPGSASALLVLKRTTAAKTANVVHGEEIAKGNWRAALDNCGPSGGAGRKRRMQEIPARLARACQRGCEAAGSPSWVRRGVCQAIVMRETAVVMRGSRFVMRRAPFCYAVGMQNRDGVSTFLAFALQNHGVYHIDASNPFSDGKRT
jgi:hypothetical protein